MQLQICMIQSARGRTYIPAFLDRESCGVKMKLMKNSSLLQQGKGTRYDNRNV